MAQHWAQSPMPRDQMTLFSPTLDDAISQDHPVRLLDEILRQQDWGCTEFCVKQCGTAILAVVFHGLEARATKFRTVPRIGRTG
jgi:hypothetical protein